MQYTHGESQFADSWPIRHQIDLIQKTLNPWLATSCLMDQNFNTMSHLIVQNFKLWENAYQFLRCCLTILFTLLNPNRTGIHQIFLDFTFLSFSVAWDRVLVNRSKPPQTTTSCCKPCTVTFEVANFFNSLSYSLLWSSKLEFSDST